MLFAGTSSRPSSCKSFHYAVFMSLVLEYNGSNQTLSLLQFYIARMLKRPDKENQTRYGAIERVRQFASRSRALVGWHMASLQPATSRAQWFAVLCLQRADRRMLPMPAHAALAAGPANQDSGGGLLDLAYFLLLFTKPAPSVVYSLLLMAAGGGCVCADRLHRGVRRVQREGGHPPPRGHHIRVQLA